MLGYYQSTSLMQINPDFILKKIKKELSAFSNLKEFI